MQQTGACNETKDQLTERPSFYGILGGVIFLGNICFGKFLLGLHMPPPSQPPFPAPQMDLGPPCLLPWEFLL